MQQIIKLFQSFIWSYYGLINVILLYLLSVFLFSLLGCFVYKDIQYSSLKEKFTNVNEFYNFDDFHRAVIIVLHSSYENFDYYLFEYIHANYTDSNNVFSTSYFFFYHFFCFIIMLNFVLLVIMMQYDEFYNKTENPIDLFEHISKEFKRNWHELVLVKDQDQSEDLMKINRNKIKTFFEKIEKDYTAEKKDKLTKKELLVSSSNLFISNLRLLV